jgi:hypothetical protein
MAVRTSAVVGAFVVLAAPIVRRMPRRTARTPSLAGRRFVAGQLVPVTDGGGAAADGGGLAAGARQPRQVGSDDADMRR